LRKIRWLILVMFLAAIGGAVYALSRFSLSALDEPGRMETYVATKARIWLVRRAAREMLPPAPANDATSVAVGQMTYTGECASCHGTDGRTPTEVGRSMYPRTIALDSPEVQQWSDPELFWIIKHGIRLSGMPGFGKIHSDDQIWNLVHYVRSAAKP
jgi:mono/diheme cytochrome c family protein